jgi:hypothetical protein
MHTARTHQRTRRVRRLTPLAAQLCLLLAGIGCAVDARPGADTPDRPLATEVAAGEEQLIAAYLRDSGFDTSDLRIDPELNAAVMGDMAFNLDEIRDGLYADKGYDLFNMTARFDTPSGPVTPYTVQKVDSDLIGHIKLSFETPETTWWATEPVNDFWKAAYRNAAYQWSHSNSRININENNNGGNRGAILSIIMTTRPFCDKDGDGRNNCLAQAAMPGFGFQGNYILVDPTFPTNCAGNWIPPGCSGGGCFVRMIHNALHEMGHTLGFAHTGCGHRIAGTAADATCDVIDGGYPSEMWPAIQCDDDGLLKPDDILSASKVYPR